MRALPFVLIAACACTPPATTTTTQPAAAPAPADTSAQTVELGPEWAPVRAMVGAWEGTDPDRQSTGRFTLAPELGGKVLVRRSVNESPQERHEDLMIIFPTPAGLRASYFDNEGHVIHYSIRAEGPRIELLSDEVAGAPRFKLVYVVKSDDELELDFSIAMPGATEFTHYTGGTVHRAAQ